MATTDRRPRLLLVDDDELFLEDVALLMDRDIECVCLTDPTEAVATAERVRPDAVLLDLDYDGVMLGFDILADLRAALPGLPVYLWSEACEEEVWPRGRALGASGVMSKTTPPREIIERLRESGRWPPGA